MKRFFSALLLLLLLFVLAGCQSQTVAPADKAAFLSIADLRAFGYANPKPPAGKWSKTSYGGGTYEVEYEVETPDSEAKFPLYWLQMVSQEESAGEAAIYLATSRAAMNLTLKTEKLSETTLPKATVYGDGSTLTVLKDGKTSLGNIFSARKKGRTYSVMLVGIAFEDPKEWDAFAGRKVRAWIDGAK